MLSVDNYHPPIAANIDIRCPLKTVKVSSFRNFRKINYHALNRLISSIDWCTILDVSQDVNEMLATFYTHLESILNKFAPLIEKKTSKYPAWYSKNTINLLKNKLIYHKKWHRYKNMRDLTFFKRFRTELKLNISDDYKNHVLKVENDIKSNPKSFWKFVNEKKRNDTGIPEIVSFNSEILKNCTDRLDLFAKYFGSVYNRVDDYEKPEVTDFYGKSIGNISISMQAVHEKLKNLDLLQKMLHVSHFSVICDLQ
jgi:hypothetical protein